MVNGCDFNKSKNETKRTCAPCTKLFLYQPALNSRMRITMSRPLLSLLDEKSSYPLDVNSA